MFRDDSFLKEFLHIDHLYRHVEQEVNLPLVNVTNVYRRDSEDDLLSHELSLEKLMASKDKDERLVLFLSDLIYLWNRFDCLTNRCFNFAKIFVQTDLNKMKSRLYFLFNFHRFYIDVRIRRGKTITTIRSYRQSTCRFD